MASKKSPLSGYNHNLKYKGRVYHVQTEDSGLENPHIFTHLFYDGTILSTKKQDYDKHLSDPEWEEAVRKEMQSLHKDMMKELLKGSHDDRIVQYLGVLEVEDEAMPIATLPPPPQRIRSESAPEPEDVPAAASPVPMSQPGVVVSAPMVIIADDGQQFAATPAPPPTATFKPQESKAVPDSIFGGDLISEKSLDEVILAYLSEDMADD